MLKNFTHGGKTYRLKMKSTKYSQWACIHPDGLQTWAIVSVPHYKVKRQDVIDAIKRMENHHG